ncbi:S-layer homology domain-containing protein [Paenibacillus sp. CMAA1364]
MRLVQAEALPSQQQVNFKDWHTVGGFAVDAVQKAAEAGIISGYQGELRPKGEASRAETSVMLLHLLELEPRIQSIVNK